MSFIGSFLVMDGMECHGTLSYKHINTLPEANTAHTPKQWSHHTAKCLHESFS